MSQCRDAYRATVLVAAAFLPACGADIDDLATRLSEKSLEHSHVFHLVEGQAARFHSCLEERGGTCEGAASTPLPHAAGAATDSAAGTTPVKTALGSSLHGSITELPGSHPAKVAAAALAHPVLSDVAALHDHLRGVAAGSSENVHVEHDEDGKTVHMQLSASQAQELMSHVSRASASGGWHALTAHAADHLAAAEPGSDEHADATADHRLAAFLAAYVEAYFRNGRLLAVDLTVDKGKAIADLGRELGAHAGEACGAYHVSRTIAAGGTGAAEAEKPETPATGSAAEPAGPCAALATALYRGALGSGAADPTKQYHLLTVPQTGFVSRDGGLGLQFPRLQVDVDPTASHAIAFHGGASGRLDYTQIGTDLLRVVLEAVFDAHEGLPAVQNATGRNVGAYSLPPVPAALAGDLGAMHHATQTATTTAGTVLDRLIRGLGPVSINNEALEEMIVALVSTSVRKSMEKAVWCWYACGLESDLQKTVAGVHAEEHKAPGEMRALAYEGAKHVKLALHMSH